MFITFEGIEGCGKSTQAKLLAEKLQELSIPVINTREPGGSRIGQEIRKMLLDAGNVDLSPLAELFLYAADRAHHVDTMIKPALLSGTWIICDRYFDATVAYQGYARGQDLSLIHFLNQKASQQISPDMTFLIDCPVEAGLERAIKRNQEDQEQGQDRFEKEKLSFHDNVRKGYLAIAEKEKSRFVIIDGTLEVEAVKEIIFEHVQPYIL